MSELIDKYLRRMEHAREVLTEPMRKAWDAGFDLAYDFGDDTLPPTFLALKPGENPPTDDGRFWRIRRQADRL